MKSGGRLFRWIKDHSGLVVLLVILTIISVLSVKLGFYFIGWDNYSSYFEPGINIFRTLFASWRDYRGLGVPSDAEVTDVFRQLLFVPLSFVFPRELLDQIYYLIAQWIGVLGMYAFSGMVVNDLPLLLGTSARRKDIFGCIAALFYLFNLNTLSVFYSPIIPFTNRFYSLPLTLAILLWFLGSKPTWRRFLVIAITVVVTSGSYITPTVIITTLVAYGMFALSRFSLKQTVLYGFVFLVLNAFWILPFVNYTRQKASIVPLARTFIEINESTLNRPASDFSWDKQAVLRPSFFDLNFRSLSGQSFPVHPLFDEYIKSGWHSILFLFPVFYAAGALIILVQGKKAKRAFWIPAWIAVFIFLSMKEFSPLGFIYVWLKDHVPFFDIIFRISDTKFHTYMSFGGSIAAAYAIMSLLFLFRQKSVQIFFAIVLFIVGFGYLWPFRTYFTGDLIGSLAYTKIPNAYFDIARVINETPGEGRVLHLPMDSWHSYWRSFSWGYVGSSFFHYFINKPYIDKTFEPASLENSYLHNRIQSLIDSFYRTSDQTQKKRFAGEFIELLRRTGVQYVLLDESITSNIYARNMTHEAKQWYSQAQELVRYSASQEDLVRKGTYGVPLEEYYKAYEKMYPVRRIGRATSAPIDAHIDLYEVKGVLPAIGFPAAAQFVDQGLVNLLETGFSLTNSNVVMQETGKPAQILPFLQERHSVERSNDGFTLGYDNPNTTPLQYRITGGVAESDSYMIDVSGRVVEDNLQLMFSHRYYPDINGKRFARPIGSLSIPLPKITGVMADQYRLKLNDVFLPLPTTITAPDVSLGSFMLHEKTIRASLLTKRSEKVVSLATFTPTDPPSCFGTPPKTYEGKVVMSEERGITLSARYGSVCARAAGFVLATKNNKPYYAELELVLNGAAQGESPVHAYVCLKEGSGEECLNTHRNFRMLPNTPRYRMPVRSSISNAAVYTLDIGVVAPDGITHALDITSAQIILYEPGKEQDLAFTPFYPKEQVTVFGPLNVSFPRAISAFSYFQNPSTDLFYVPLEPCRGEKPAERTVRILVDSLVTRMVNCSTHFAQWFQYAPDRPYLFAYEYWLGVGQQPSIVLGLKGDNYLFERASLYQGYPISAGMKGLQGEIKLVGASRFIEPRFFSDSAPADTAIHLFQDTANEGVLAVRGFDMVEYPAAWQRMTITPDDSSVSYPAVQTPYVFKQILPSLWKIEGDIPQGAQLRFNRGYDQQWGIYDSLLGVAFGRSLAPSIRCDGFANCFHLPAGRTFYIFYTPERLSLLGWAGTLATILILSMVIKGKSRAS